MVNRKQLSDSELDEVILQSTMAADLARIAGLEIAGRIATIRADQAKIEVARVRFKKGKDAPEAPLKEAAAKAQAERGAAARDISGSAKKGLDAVLKSFADRKQPVVTRPEPPVSEPVPPRGGPLPPRDPDPAPGGAAGFEIKGKVVKGQKAVPGLAVEARSTVPVKTVARATSGNKGEFVLQIADVKKLKKGLGIAAAKPLKVKVLALKGRRIIASGDDTIEVKPGANVSVRLKLG